MMRLGLNVHRKWRVAESSCSAERVAAYNPIRSAILRRHISSHLKLISYHDAKCLVSITGMDGGGVSRVERENANSTRPLLQMPCEVRLQIYDILLKSNEIVDVREPRLWHTFNVRYDGFRDGPSVLLQGAFPGHKRYSHRTALGIAQVCRQLRDEAERYYYGSNTFLLRTEHDPYQSDCLIQEWLGSIISRTAMESLRSILLIDDLVGEPPKMGSSCTRAYLLDFQDNTAHRVNTGCYCLQCAESRKHNVDLTAGTSWPSSSLSTEDHRRAELVECLVQFGLRQRKIAAGYDD